MYGGRSHDLKINYMFNCNPLYSLPIYQHISMVPSYENITEDMFGLSCAKLGSSWFQAYSAEVSHGISGKLNGGGQLI